MSEETKQYNPDVLSCIANLSNDEVFTPPEVANGMLDILPQELFENPETTFLDPAAKSGVFLREIAKRLMEGLKDAIPDEEERRQHIFKKQIFGIAITELTGFISRRSLYCSKAADGKYSVATFDNSDGNIHFNETQHTWERGKCRFCGASQEKYGGESREGLETHAYEFIHTLSPEEIFNMKFDVIISNPPYQLSDGGGNGSSSAPIYQKFVCMAQQLCPRFIVMIIPARWYSGGKGLDDFRDMMINDCSIRELHDFFDAEDCFPGIDISGGVCYFLWCRDKKGMCKIITHSRNSETEDLRYLHENGCDVFIRYKMQVEILRRVRSFEEGQTFDSLVSSRRPFGLGTECRGKSEPFNGAIKLHSSAGTGYISCTDLEDNCKQLKQWKLYVSVVYGERGDFPYLVIGKPFLGEPDSACTDSYLSIGPFKSRDEAENVRTYMQTRFFRFLVLIQKNTQIAPKKVYSFVPMQDFARPWTDEDLYKKYKLEQSEIDFIDSMIRPMVDKVAEGDKTYGGDDGDDTYAA